MLETEVDTHRVALLDRIVETVAAQLHVPKMEVGDDEPKSVIRISLCRTAKRNPLIFVENSLLSYIHYLQITI